MEARLVWLPRVWAIALALLMLWPVLGGGYVLTYDMVWVPDLVLRPDFLGLGSGLPRAVPSDAVVSLLDEVVPGQLLQKVVLLGAVVAGGCGAAGLAGGRSLAARLVAVSVYVWSPFVAERAVIGHWPVLLAYAVLPFVITAGRRAREEARLPLRLLVLLPLGSLSAGAGIACAVALLAFGLRRGAGRTNAVLVAAAVAANAPWLVSGVLHAADATSAALGARVFALHDEGPVPGPLAALTGGGIWNAEVVPASRTEVTGWLALLLVALAVLGLRRWVRATGRRDLVGHAVCWGTGWGLAVLGFVAPGAMGWLVAHVPGAGLVRDGTRLLVLCLPALACACAAGAEVVLDRAPRGLPRLAAGVAAVLLPVALMPDAANGVAGRLRPVAYPASYARLASALAGTAKTGGDVLFLPFTSYRAPAWNGRRSVLDPATRYQPRDYVASDDLVVDGRTVAGEDPRGAVVRRALAQRTPAARADALSRGGVGLVVLDRASPAAAPDIAADRRVRAGSFTLLALPSATPREVPPGWVVAMTAAWLAYLGLVVTYVARRVRQGVRGRR